MSRIGVLPITLPKGVSVTREGAALIVKGPKGTLSRELRPEIEIKIEEGQILCERPSNDKLHRSLHGLTRTLVNNMVVGVSEGYEKKLEVNGVGYRAELSGKSLNLSVGLSHQVLVEPMEGIEFEVGQDTNTRMPFVIVRCIDKEILGQQCAYIKKVRPVEPYKGKGIKFAGEWVRRKAGKAGKAGK